MVRTFYVWASLDPFPAGHGAMVPWRYAHGSTGSGGTERREFGAVQLPWELGTGTLHSSVSPVEESKSHRYTHLTSGSSLVRKFNCLLSSILSVSAPL